MTGNAGLLEVGHEQAERTGSADAVAYDLGGPAIVQDWNAGARFVVEPRTADPFPTPPRIGLVIGTFAAVPYIHLQLEARQQFYPHVPMLVHDDASHRREDLSRLCRRYGCDFESNERRQPPCVGDLTAFVGGLVWAGAKGVDLLVKASRRWVFLTDWATDLQSLALRSQYATFGSYTTSFNFGFRTECLGLAVAAWTGPPFWNDATRLIARGQSVFVEGYVHEFARTFERWNSPAAEQWRLAHPQPADRNGYALWDLMGTDRCERSPHFLWHDSSGPDDYLALSRKWGLPYTAADFADPNQGGGNGT